MEELWKEALQAAREQFELGLILCNGRQLFQDGHHLYFVQATLIIHVSTYSYYNWMLYAFLGAPALAEKHGITNELTNKQTKWKHSFRGIWAVKGNRETINQQHLMPI